jgi:hypothetical protein
LEIAELDITKYLTTTSSLGKTLDTQEGMMMTEKIYGSVNVVSHADEFVTGYQKIPMIKLGSNYPDKGVMH